MACRRAALFAAVSASLSVPTHGVPTIEEPLDIVEHRFELRTGGEMEVQRVLDARDPGMHENWEGVDGFTLGAEGIDAPGLTDISDERKLERLWNAEGYRDWFFNLTRAEDEHACFKGFNSLIKDTNRCKGWQRPQPEVGTVQEFKNRIGGGGKSVNFTLAEVVGTSVNVWLEEGMAEDLKQIALTAADLYTNKANDDLLKPAPGSNSWMEHECEVFGTLPFVFTCSNRLNILVETCGFSNAFVQPNDYLRNYPHPATETSDTNFDLIFYQCIERLADNSNPYDHAQTYAHEVAHVIQFGFGKSFTAMTEGGATWLEGTLLNLPPRPMVYAWGFRDWNFLNAAHIYTNTPATNARKAYQIHQMFLTYLMQDEILGVAGASAIQNYGLYDAGKRPFGRSSYDYFLMNGLNRPKKFTPLIMDVEKVTNAWADAMLDYRVALTSACISKKEHRPKEPRYRMPELLADKPFWDCTQFQVFWANTQEFPTNIITELFYGGAAVYRIATPVEAKVSMPADADANIRTKVMAPGDDCDNGAEVKELRPGGTVSFAGSCAREVFVIQVNTDPAGETRTLESLKGFVRRSNFACTAPCEGDAWAVTGLKDGEVYPNSYVASLQTDAIEVPAGSKDTALSFVAMWDIEEPSFAGSDECGFAGWDGMQIRVHTLDENGKSKGYKVVAPKNGYTEVGPDKQGVVRQFQALNPKAPDCGYWAGWSGKSPGFDLAKPEWISVFVDLGGFAAAQTIKIEFFFASDGASGGKGFFVDGVKVVDTGAVLYDENDRADGGLTPSFEDLGAILSSFQGKAGDLDSYSKTPVTVGYPEGFYKDSSVSNMATRRAPWSATWAAAPANSVASKKRAYIGHSYSAAMRARETHIIRTGQEACVTLQAPITGVVEKVTLFTLVDKIGIDRVYLALRSASEPYRRFIPYPVMYSESPRVNDEGIHTFFMGDKPPLEAGRSYLFCTGIGRTRKLTADGDLKPFFHLPITESVNAGKDSFVLDKDDPANMTKSKRNPWGDNFTITLRAELREKELPSLFPLWPALGGGLVAVAVLVAIAWQQRWCGLNPQKEDSGTTRLAAPVAVEI